MKIGVISDTHGNVPNFRKALEWFDGQKIEVVLHCGDIGSPDIFYESLQGFKGRLFGVFGNMDKNFNFSVNEYNKLENIKIEENTFEGEIGGKKIAINHFPSEAKKLALSGKYDLVFYGHTHRPWDEKINGCHLVNPGELANHFFKPTFAVYDTETNSLELKILENL